MKTGVLTIAAALVLLLPAPLFAAGACAALTKTPEYQSVRGLEPPVHYRSQRLLLREKLMGEECNDNEIIAMMEGLGWTFGGKASLNSPTSTDSFDHWVSFCDKRRGFLSHIFDLSCRGRAVVGLRGDTITFLAIHGNI